MQGFHLSIRIYVILAIAALLSACANTTRPGAVGVNRSQLMVASSEEVNRISAASYNEQNQKAKDKNILVTSGPTYDRLKFIANRLIPQTVAFRDDTNQWDWRLTLINAPVLNATCAPGGKITFYTGIIEQLNLNDDEIAAIMGHEIAHALREHGRERVSQAAAQNVFVNIAGGIKVEDPAIELALVCALLSSYEEKPLPSNIVLIGEIGLSGEIRAVNRIDQRIAEAEKLGMDAVIVPKSNAKGLDTSKFGIKIKWVNKIEDVYKLIF
jgi:Zn-dependent protease with chaperone function